MDVLAVTAPVYLLIGAGWAAARLGVVSAADLSAAGRVVLALCLPALIFRAVLSAGMSGDGALNLRLIGAAAAAGLTVLAAGVGVLRLMGHPPAAAWILALGMAAPNSLFVGFPVAAAAFGIEAAGAILAQMLVVENLLVIPAGLILSDVVAYGSGAARGALRAAAARLVRNPLLWAIAVALGALASGLRPPGPLDRALEMLAAVAPGAALLIVGGAMAGQPLRSEIASAATITAGKLMAHPFVMLATLAAARVPGDVTTIALVFAAAPMMTVFPLLASRHAGPALPATAMVMATVLSFGSVSLALALLA